MCLCSKACTLPFFPQIDRRVAAFLDHKRVEVNEGNIREFRSAMSSEQGKCVSGQMAARYSSIV